MLHCSIDVPPLDFRETSFCPTPGAFPGRRSLCAPSNYLARPSWLCSVGLRRFEPDLRPACAPAFGLDQQAVGWRQVPNPGMNGMLIRASVDRP